MLSSRPTWQLRTPTVDATLRLLEDRLPAIGELFDVKQGVQTGRNPALVLTREEWRRLPEQERKYFRQATMSDSIKNGRIVRPYYIFFPHQPSGPVFGSEKQLRQAVPDFYERYLAPNKDALMNRATIVRSKRTDWWGLMEPRT